jgi:hypothetical protein
LFIDADRSSYAGRFRRPVGASSLVMLVVLASLGLAGCASHQPPEASITQIANFDRPAKSPDCSMPMLRVEPLTPHHKIAIVEAWGDFGEQDAILAALRRSACQTGADALVIVENQSQIDPRTLTFGLPENLQAQEARTDMSQAERYKQNEVKPAVGAHGHPGLYIDSVAIVYEKVKGDRATGN